MKKSEVLVQDHFPSLHSETVDHQCCQCFDLLLETDSRVQRVVVEDTVLTLSTLGKIFYSNGLISTKLAATKY